MTDFLTYAAMASISFLVSTFLIGWGIPKLKKDDAAALAAKRPPVFAWQSPGLWIGVCEIAIIFPLICHSEYGALAFLFAAKEYVQKEKIQKDPARYLLGTLANLALAILFALWARSIVGSGAGESGVLTVILT